jgi:Novel STAND NTPase 1
MRESPYVGPRPFLEKDAQYFAGRDSEIIELAATIKANSLTVFYAPSGAGKTSLLNAGVVPSLRDAFCDVFPVGRFGGMEEEASVSTDPDINPFASNLISSVTASSERGSGDTLRVVRELLKPSADQSLSRIRRRRVLIVDQAEELFTRYSHHWEKRAELVRVLVQSAVEEPGISVVLALREDYLPALEALLRTCGFRTQGRFRLPLLGEAQAVKAVTEPALRQRVRFSPRAAELQVALLRGDHEFVEPLTLQAVCLRLWENLPEEETTISAEHVGKWGQVDAALEEYFDIAIAKAAKELQKNEWVLRHFIETCLLSGDRTQRRLFDLNAFPAGRRRDEASRIVGALDRQQLLRPEVRRGVTYFELGHDQFVGAVIRSNAKQSGEFSAILQGARAWLSGGQSDERLLSAEQVRFALTWLAKYDPEGLVREEVEGYLRRSQEVATERIERERKELECLNGRLNKTNTRLKLVAALAIAALLLAAVLSIAVYSASQALKVRNAQIYGEVAVRVSNDPPELLSAMLAVAALGESESAEPMELLAEMWRVLKSTTSPVSNSAEDAIKALAKQVPFGRAFWKPGFELMDRPILASDGQTAYVRTRKNTQYLIDANSLSSRELPNFVGTPFFVGGSKYLVNIPPTGYGSPTLIETASLTDFSRSIDKSRLPQGSGDDLVACCQFTAQADQVLLQGANRAILRSVNPESDSSASPLHAEPNMLLQLSRDGSTVLKVSPSDKNKGWAGDVHDARTDEHLGHVRVPNWYRPKEEPLNFDTLKTGFRLSPSGATVVFLRPNTETLQRGDYSQPALEHGPTSYVAGASVCLGDAGSERNDPVVQYDDIVVWRRVSGTKTWRRQRVEGNVPKGIWDVQFVADAVVLLVSGSCSKGYSVQRISVPSDDSRLVTMTAVAHGVDAQNEQPYRAYRFVPRQHPKQILLFRSDEVRRIGAIDADDLAVALSLPPSFDAAGLEFSADLTRAAVAFGAGRFVQFMSLASVNRALDRSGLKTFACSFFVAVVQAEQAGKELGNKATRTCEEWQRDKRVVMGGGT